MQLYGTIQKIEPQEDGTVKVYGIASSEQEDSDGEIVLASAMRAALPDYLTFGAVREMHQPTTAAGTAIEASVDAYGMTTFGAHVVDPVAVKKVQTRVYKGFSIGGKVTARNKKNPKVIEGIKLTEISLVDRPANPAAVFSLVKFEDSDKGEAMARPRGKKAAAAGAKASPLKKGMMDVAQLAALIDGLNYLRECAVEEAEVEGDGSPVPEELRGAVDGLSAILVAMAAEEGKELTGGAMEEPEAPEEMEGEPEAEVMAADAAPLPEAKPGMQDQPADGMAPEADGNKVAKAGAVFSAPTKAKLKDIHEMLKQCVDKMDAIGYVAKDDMSDDGANATTSDIADGAKADAIGDLVKVSGERDALAKQMADLEAEKVRLTDALAAATAKSDELVGEVQTLIKSMKASGVLRSVGKVDDVNQSVEKRDGGDVAEDSVEAMKKVHRGGGRLLTTR